MLRQNSAITDISLEYSIFIINKDIFKFIFPVLWNLFYSQRKYLSWGEICMANFIPPENGVSQVIISFLKVIKWTFYEEKKTAFKNSSGSQMCKLFKIGFWFCLVEISNNLWRHLRGCVDFFFQLNLVSSYSLHSQGDNLYDKAPGFTV